MRTVMPLIFGALLAAGCASDADPSPVVSSAGVEVDASDRQMCMFGSVRGSNDAGSPVTIAVDVGVYQDGELLEFRTGRWDAPTGFSGWLDGLEEWSSPVWNMGDHSGYSCKIRDLEVTERG